MIALQQRAFDIDPVERLLLRRPRPGTSPSLFLRVDDADDSVLIGVCLPALRKGIADDREQRQPARPDVLIIGGDMHQVERVLHHSDRDRAEQHADRGAPPAEHAGAADHDRGHGRQGEEAPACGSPLPMRAAISNPAIEAASAQKM